MKILLASESFYPVVSGVAVAVERAAAEMTKRGHTVTVVAPSDGRRYSKQHKDGYLIYRLPSRSNPFKNGHRFTASSYRYIKRVFDEVQPDIVHIHDPAVLCRSTARKARKYGIPVVATQHFNFEYILTYLPSLKQFHFLIQYMAERTIYAFYNHCSILIVPSKTLQATLESPQLKVPITIISNGVDTQRFKPSTNKAELRAKYGIPASTPTILYVGRIDPEKNIKIILQSLKELPDVHLVLIGKGACVEDLHIQAKELAVENRITWIDPVSHSDPIFPSLYQLGDIFCIASPIETESIVTMEAMAAGLPVIAANTGALKELVSDLNGRLVNPQSLTEWISAIDQIIHNKELLKEMSIVSLKKIEKRDSERSFGQLESLYSECIKD